MTATEALTKLKVMLGLETEVVTETTTATETPETVEVEFAEETLVDGTVVRVEGDLEVGKQLSVVTEEGEIAAPEGAHQTQSNKLITVDAEGVIVSIEDLAEEPAQEEVTEEVVVEETTAEDFSQVVDQIANLIKPSLDQINELKDQLATLEANFSAFKDEPATKKITNNLEQFKAAKKSNEEARFEALRQIRKNY
jgi:hypothetical protein